MFFEGDHMTNGDRIRKMSNEELAEVIMCPHDIEPGMCNTQECEKGCWECVRCCKEWLEKEYE